MSSRRSILTAAALLGAAAVACVIASIVWYAPASGFGPGWQTAQASVVSSDVLKSHDSVGRLLFQVRTVFRFEAQGKERIATAVSDFPTHEFNRVMRKLQDFDRGTSHTIVYRTSNPETIKFGGEFLWWNLRKPLVPMGAGILLAAIALLLLLKRPPRECKNCGAPAKSYYFFCPRCAATVSAA